MTSAVTTRPETTRLIFTCRLIHDVGDPVYSLRSSCVFQGKKRDQETAIFRPDSIRAKIWGFMILAFSQHDSSVAFPPGLLSPYSIPGQASSLPT